jgi:hypothetical protein
MDVTRIIHGRYGLWEIQVAFEIEARKGRYAEEDVD